MRCDVAVVNSVVDAGDLEQIQATNSVAYDCIALDHPDGGRAASVGMNGDW